jgi:hypothetical protein
LNAGQVFNESEGQNQSKKTREQALGDFGEDRAIQLLGKKFAIEEMPEKLPVLRSYG